jgi:hypothetical protein
MHVCTVVSSSLRRYAGTCPAPIYSSGYGQGPKEYLVSLMGPMSIAAVFSEL